MHHVQIPVNRTVTVTGNSTEPTGFNPSSFLCYSQKIFYHHSQFAVSAAVRIDHFFPLHCGRTLHVAYLVLEYSQELGHGFHPTPRCRPKAEVSASFGLNSRLLV